MIDLDFKQEVTAVADFVAAKWEPLENLQSIVELIATDAYVDSRALISRFSANEVLTLLVRKREALLQGLSTQPFIKTCSNLLTQDLKQCTDRKQ